MTAEPDECERKTKPPQEAVPWLHGQLPPDARPSIMARMVNPICPRCASPGVPLLLGLPAPAAVEAATAGQLALGGCRVKDDGTDPNWRCTARGHRWRDADQALWEAALEGALAGRPHCPRCGSASRIRIDARHAQWYEREIRFGHAVVVADADLPGGEHECLGCGHLWVPTRRG